MSVEDNFKENTSKIVQFALNERDNLTKIDEKGKFCLIISLGFKFKFAFSKFIITEIPNEHICTSFQHMRQVFLINSQLFEYFLQHLVQLHQIKKIN